MRTGVAITNLKLEDFELTVDGQAKPISENHPHGITGAFGDAV
jgi:hypothetical protein